MSLHSPSPPDAAAAPPREPPAVHPAAAPAGRDWPQTGQARAASLHTFRALCERIAAHFDRQGSGYLGAHLRRFYDTYRFILKHYGEPARLASLGAGSAYVEAALAELHGARVVVYDLPEALPHHADLYESLGFQTAPVDLSQPVATPAPARPIDLILCAEVVEHLPLAPSTQFSHAFTRIGAAAPLVVTTPNTASLRHLLKLLFMRPLLPPAELTFAESCFETEGVHRREYLAREIIDAFALVGHRFKALEYSWYHRPIGMAEAVIYPLELLTPRFRPCMLIGSTPAARAPSPAR